MSIRQAYDKWSSIYDTNKNRTRDMDKQMSIQMLQDLHFDKVLELGCGTGKNTEWLHKNATKLTCIDLSEKMLAVARKKFAGRDIDFQQQDITRPWTWTNQSFNLLSFNLVLEHIQDLDFVFKEAYSKLENSGYLYISELHPFKQYLGTKARFESEDQLVELETFTHHISDFLNTGRAAGFRLQNIAEGFDEEPGKPPRILSILFQKP